MNEFIVKHQKQVLGMLSGFDRVRFRGTFRVLAVAKLLMVWRTQRRVLIKDFRDLAESLTQGLKRAVEQVASQRVRDIEFLRSSKYSKEDLVAELIRREGLTEGVVCVLSAVEPCRSYEVRRNPETKTLDLEAPPRKCLHWYVDFLDAVLGLCHVRIQSWLPFTVHVCVNGRDMLCRELTRQGIGFERRDNCLARVDDIAAAQQILDSQPWAAWSTRLDDLVRRACPPLLEIPGFLGRPHEYDWSADETEWASDVMFRSNDALAAVNHPTPLGTLVDQLAQAVVTKTCRARGLHPLTGLDAQLVTILLRGEFALNGFRNRDVREALFPPPDAPPRDTTSADAGAATLAQRRRQSGQVTRLLRLFRAHGLIQKILRTHRYQLTTHGRRLLPTFPNARAANTQALTQIAA